MNHRISRTWQIGILIVISSIACAYFHYDFIYYWNPKLSHDTHYYYYRSQEILNNRDASFGDLFIAPFYLASAQTPLAHESKPVFAAALRGWGLVYRWASHPDEQFPHRQEYVGFLIVTIWLFFLAICWTGIRLKRPLSGVITAIIVLCSPWGLTACHFTTYTACSMVIFLSALNLLLSKSRRMIAVAGVLSGLAILTNQSLLVYIAGLGLLAIWLYLPSWKQAGVSAGLYGLGVGFPYLFFELGKYSGYVAHLMGTAQIDSPIGILYKYLLRSGAERSEVFEAYKGSLLYLILWNNSVVVFMVFLLIPLIFLYEFFSKNRPRLLKHPLIFNAVIIGLPAIVGIISIEFHTGPKFSRSYFLGYPLLVFAMLFFLEYLWKSHKYWGYVVCVAAGLYLGEMSYHLEDYYAAFNGVGKYVCSLENSAPRIALFKQDTYAPFLQDLLQELPCRDDKQFSVTIVENVADIRRQQSDILMTGPHISSVLEGTHTQPLAFPYVRNNFPDIDFILPTPLPFFALYPLLILEDPVETYKYVIMNPIDADYRNGSGSVKLWKIAYQPVSQ